MLGKKQEVSKISKLNPQSLGKVWIVCDYPILALGLQEILKSEAQIYEGREIPAGTSPSCVVFCPNGVEEVAKEVRRIHTLSSEAPVVIFGLRVDLSLARAGLQAGARGFMHAGMKPAQIVRALSLATRGQVVVPRELLQGLVVGEEEADLSTLTPRQRQILRLVAEGLTNSQIAENLYLSEFTIKQHLRSAYKALKVKNRTEAARLIRQSSPNLT